MSYIHQLSQIITSPKKRLGRGKGSGKGSKSGRGTTRHQKARTDIKISFEGGQNKLTKKFPLLRGKGRNKPSSVRPYTVTIADLSKIEGKIVNIESLMKAKLVPSDALKRKVKLLSTGEITKALTVQVSPSKSAKTKIEKAGGEIVNV